ncbi:MAG: hypothetical protein CMJ49_04285 [Planctomycetaceae bacterium]|nr:hypothetical protein [Planctomycetaceae bacterium]
MGTITSGVGLISGIDTAGLIDQLMAIEARPRTLVEQRVADLTTQKTAFLDINARLLALKISASAFADDDVFATKTATSSDSSAISATATNSAVPGTYNIAVSRLVANQQLITEGFADTDTTAIGAGTLTFESHLARLDRKVDLLQLNGEQGVDRGSIRITDRSGVSATIDLTRTITLDEVIDAINTNSTINVTASIDGDQLKITDNTGQSASNLIIVNTGATQTATDLGILGNVAANEISGTQINTITSTSRLAALNDGLGVRILDSLPDLTITDHTAATFDVDLAGSTTVGDVIDAINAASTTAGSNVVAAIGDDNVSIKLTDSTPFGGTELKVDAANGSNAATDLGFNLSDINQDGTLEGDRLLASMGSVLLKNLNGGQGVSSVFSLSPSVLTDGTLLSELFDGAGLTTSGSAAVDVRLLERDGSPQINVDLDTATTVGDLRTIFSTATGGGITLSIVGRALQADDNTLPPPLRDIGINNLNGSLAMTELGLEINAPVYTVLGTDTFPLRSEITTPATFGPGQIDITNRAGTQTEIDLSTARSVSDILDTINNAGAGVTASLNSAGNGFLITDTSGGTGDLIIADVQGDLATTLGFAGTHSASSVNGGSAQMQYIGENTLLADLNAGAGISAGKFQITDSTGDSSEVDLTQGDEITIADVIAEINSRPIAVTASINATGDGILLTDSGNKTSNMRVTEVGGTTAADLGILGIDTDLNDEIDGSFEKTVEIEYDVSDPLPENHIIDTLEDVVAKINDADIGISATIINDGSPLSPFRLNISSDLTGADGRILFDDGGLDFNASTLVEGSDAVALFGSADPTQAILITSSSNTLTNTIPGLTIDLLATTDSAVELTVARDEETVIASVRTFVEGFNSLIGRVNALDSFDPETEERGLLLGDRTLAAVRRQMFSLITQRYNDVSTKHQFLGQVGITIGANATLLFNEVTFRDALADDPDAVANLFSLKDQAAAAPTEIAPGITVPSTSSSVTANGFGHALDALLDRFTDSIDGTLTRTTLNIDNQIELANDRIENLNLLLDGKRAKLEAEFLAMERALATLQSQQSSLAGLTTLASSASSTNSLFGG